MAGLDEILQKYGREKRLSPDDVLIRQGAVSDGVYYLKSGRLGAYKEEQGSFYPLSEILPGRLVGELGSTTGWARTATVKAEEESVVVHVPEADFHLALRESPDLAATVVWQIGEHLTSADAVRITLGRSYQRAAGRVETLTTEKVQLEELLRLREELADMIVHDLRNPLTVIINGLQLLDDVSVSDADRDYASVVVDTMGRATQRMERLVDTLLDIARFEEGAMALLLQPLDVASLIEETVTGERHLAENKGMTLEARLTVELPAISADRDVFQRALVNLLDNALKFTPAGGHVWVEAHPEAEAVRVDVVDTGPGIPVGERERIFEKFTQVRGQAGSRRGSGLGLTFCRMAVESHGGRLWIEDGPGGKGSRFVFTVPRAT
ncbi:MAG: cyclic nucleotide-binding domain-containing protein [Anaerolineae bacterium]|nr:cyclic nucleotide-binding domain-containing protein [Anaerolineae bacterium]